MPDAEAILQDELRSRLSRVLPIGAVLFVGTCMVDRTIGAPFEASLQARATAAAGLLLLFLLSRWVEGPLLLPVCFGGMLCFGAGALSLSLVQSSVLNAVVIGVVTAPLFAAFVHLKLKHGLPLFLTTQLIATALPVALLWDELPAFERPVGLAGAAAALVLAVLAAVNGAALRASRLTRAAARQKLVRAKTDVALALERDRKRLEEISRWVRGIATSADFLQRSVASLRREGEALAQDAGTMRQGLQAAAANGLEVASAAATIDERARQSQRRLGELSRRDEEEGAPSRKKLKESAEAMVEGSVQITRAAAAMALVARRTRMLALNASIEAPGLSRREVDVLAERMRDFSGEARERAGRAQALAKKLAAVAGRLRVEAAAYARDQERAAADPRRAFESLVSVAQRSATVHQRAASLARSTQEQAAGSQQIAAAQTRLHEEVSALERSAGEMQGVAGGLEAWLPAGGGGP